MEINLPSTEATQELASKIADRLKAGDILFLTGDLGAGKTTFTGFLVKGLGIEDRVQSPTFVLLRKYKRRVPNDGAINVVNHLDLYRITTEIELEDLGLSEIVSEPEAITIIEWPELVPENISSRVIKLHFSESGENSRRAIISGLEI